ncbi:hypothetical protein N665_0073s0034 [Sinapis alba]|nr:hypothetical protein N665_0073s0034 [Sinapis alba]
MMNGFGMQKVLMQVSNPQACSLCNRIFLTPQDLISHTNTFHSNHHFFSSAAAPPTTFRHYRNPNPAFQAGNRFDLNYYRPANKTNFLFGQQERPKLMNLFPEMSSEGTLPLICQLEQRRPHDTTVERGGAISNSIDLTLRL